MLGDVTRMLAELLGAQDEEDFKELEALIKERYCSELRAAIERLKSRRHWGVAKIILKRHFNDLLEECGVRL